MAKAKVKAYAKLNLSLDIKGISGGFHLLDSFVCSVDLFDLIVAKPRKDDKIFVSFEGKDCEKIPKFENNVEKAARAFQKRFSSRGADIKVYRNIPVGAGMGASSADISGTLLALGNLYFLPQGENLVEEKTIFLRQLKELADELGSDTGYLLSGGFQRISGRGEILERVPTGEQKLYFLAICPSSGVSAGECYRSYDELGRTYAPTTAQAIEAFSRGDFETLGRSLFNGLTEAAVRLNEDVAEALAEAKAFSPIGVTMTGSGSAVFALFDSREMAEWAKSRYQGRFETFVLQTVVPSGTSVI